MRPAGLTVAVLLALAPAAAAQAPPPAPAAPPLDAHLRNWEAEAAALFGLSADFTLDRTLAGFEKRDTFRGTVKYLRPNLVRLRMANPGRAEDFEEYVGTGKAVYEYNGAAKTVTEYPLAPGAGAGGGHLLMDLFAGMKAADLTRRFAIELHKEDAHYVYLDLKPRTPTDQAVFSTARVALYGPKTKFAYLPAQLFVSKPNGGTEHWRFDTKGMRPNPAGTTAKDFQPLPKPAPDWTFQRAQ